MFILHVLALEDELSISDPADRTATDQSAASLAVTRLGTQRYVRRKVARQDRRQVLLSLTAEGKKAERGHLLRLLDKLMAGMGVDRGRPAMLFQDPPSAPPL